MTDPWTTRLSDYLDGTLPAEERPALDRHLAECAECRATVNDLREIVAEAGTLGDRPPATDLWPGVVARIRPGGAIMPIEEVRTARRRLVTISVPWLVAAGIALTVLSGSASWWLGQRHEPSATPVVVPRPPVMGAATRRIATVTYDQAVAELQKILEAGRGRLDSTTVQVLELNLAIIDRALNQARQAIAADPANRYLEEHLQQTLQQKLDLMRHAADLEQASS